MRRLHRRFRSTTAVNLGGGAKSDKTTPAKTQVNTTTASSGAAGIILNRVEAPRDVEEGSVWGGGVSIPIEVFGEQAAP